MALLQSPYQAPPYVFKEYPKSLPDPFAPKPLNSWDHPKAVVVNSKEEEDAQLAAWEERAEALKAPAESEEE